ncbi:MAG: helix-turn-helix transcriptional regulator [Clostridia bacterium]|nr:helix-turn-helix transcriptional regulator [Clostridia bacterium]
MFIGKAPIIDIAATGENICRLRKQHGITVVKIQNFLGLESPRSIYKWQQGAALPTVENLLGLSILLNVSMNDIIKVA